MSNKAFEHQIAEAITVLAAALVLQPGIDGHKLHADFLDIAEGLSQGPSNVGEVCKGVAGLMELFLQRGTDKPPPV